MWLCTRCLQASSFVWPCEGSGALSFTPEPFDWLACGSAWQRLGAPQQTGAINLAFELAGRGDDVSGADACCHEIRYRHNGRQQKYV